MFRRNLANFCQQRLLVLWFFDLNCLICILIRSLDITSSFWFVLPGRYTITKSYSGSCKAHRPSLPVRSFWFCNHLRDLWSVIINNKASMTTKKSSIRYHHFRSAFFNDRPPYVIGCSLQLQLSKYTLIADRGASQVKVNGSDMTRQGLVLLTVTFLAHRMVLRSRVSIQMRYFSADADLEVMQW